MTSLEGSSGPRPSRASCCLWPSAMAVRASRSSSALLKGGLPGGAPGGAPLLPGGGAVAFGADVDVGGRPGALAGGDTLEAALMRSTP